MTESRPLFAGRQELHFRAWFLGTRLDTRAYETAGSLAVNPVTTPAGQAGCAVLHRFGVAVFVDLEEQEEASFMEALGPYASDPVADPESEEADVLVRPESRERVDPEGNLVLTVASLERILAVSSILAKSTVLAHYEKQVARVFNRIESLGERLHQGRIPAKSKELLQEIGRVLTIQAWTVGRVEVTEKPELTWDDLELDRLYERLAYEYELRDRDLALSRKLELISSTAETFLELLHNRQTIRVEWYIVLLILIEVVLIVYDMVVL